MFIFVLYLITNNNKNQRIMKAIELNNDNCKEYTTEELCAICGIDPVEFENDEVLKHDVEELHNLEVEAREAYYAAKNSAEHKEKELNLYNGKIEFSKKYGMDKLTTFVQYKTLKSRIDYVVYNKGILKRHLNNKRNSQTKEF